MSQNDFKLIGDGRINGGNYGNVKITGDGIIDGDLSAQELKVVGNVWTDNNVKIDRIKITGSGKFRQVDAGDIKVSGNVDCKGKMNIKNIDLTGELKTFAGIKANKICIKGNIEDKKSIVTEEFDCSGSVDANILNSDYINIRLYGINRAKEIFGSSVNVIYPVFKNIFLRLFFIKRSSSKLEVENIEAEKIYLERTTANSVKGKNIIIGSGCNINNIEYSETISVSKSSTVNKKIKI